MSKLLDEVLIDAYKAPRSQSKNGGWYIAKPLPFYSLRQRLSNLLDGIRVIRGKSFAVHYKEDE